MRQKYLFIIAILFAFAACREDYPDMQNPRGDAYIFNWDQAFESYWRGMNNNYVFWDIDPTDWDEMYRIYKPQFEALTPFGFDSLEINNRAFDMIKEMSDSLIDHHLSISFSMPDSLYTFQPGDEEVERRDYFQFFNFYLWYELPYLLLKKEQEGRFTSVSHNFYSDNLDMYIFSGVLDEDIIYLGFDTFMLDEHKGTGDATESTIKHYQDLLDNHPHVEGIIIDLRSNFGGYNSDLPLVLGKLMPKNHTIFYNKQKIGPNRLDYGPWMPQEVQWQERERELQVPIVVLGNVVSASMAEMTILGVLSLPNGVFIGERTFGAQGTLWSDNEAFDMTYSGFFSNDIVSVFTSNVILKDIHGVIHEGVGIPPTIECLFDQESWDQGIDRQLERAVEYIRNGE